MIIRTATIDDLPQIAAVESECFPPAEAAQKRNSPTALFITPTISG